MYYIEMNYDRFFKILYRHLGDWRLCVSPRVALYSRRPWVPDTLVTGIGMQRIAFEFERELEFSKTVS